MVAQPLNMGKGKAIRTVIEHMSGDIGIIQDGDLEYDPEEYPLVIGPILDDKADAVYGSRFAASPCAGSCSSGTHWGTSCSPPSPTWPTTST